VRTAGWLMMAWLAACTPGFQDRPEDTGAGAPPELGATLNVGVHGDTAHIELHLTNTTTDVVALEFNTGQRYDMEVADAEGRLLWRWSDDMMFTQALGREAVPAGESLRYSAAWSAPTPGEYIATARLVSTNYPVELRTSFHVPGD
jgi:hypothetical protein